MTPYDYNETELAQKLAQWLKVFEKGSPFAAAAWIGLTAAGYITAARKLLPLPHVGSRMLVFSSTNICMKCLSMGSGLVLGCRSLLVGEP